MATHLKLHIFFRHGDCTGKFRHQAFDAVIRAKLMYGWESVALTPAILKRLNAF